MIRKLKSGEYRLYSRKVNPKTGKAPPVGSTVDVKNATYTNSIGDPELATVWTDPDFSASRPAFYYVRVLQVPTIRHHVYDAVALGLDPEKLGVGCNGLPERSRARDDLTGDW